MVDQQTAMDIMTGASTVVAALSVSPPTIVPPAESSMSPSDKTSAAGGTSAAGRTSTAGGTSAAVGSSAAVVGSSLRRTDSLRPDGTSPRQTSGGTSSIRTSVTPAVIEASPPALTQQTEVTQSASPPAATTLPLDPYVTSHAGTDAADAPYVPFSVTPASGQIPAGAAAEILVKFSPLDVSEYFACLSARYACLGVSCVL